MKKLSVLFLMLALAGFCFAAPDEDDNPTTGRLKAAATVLQEIQAAPDTGIPDEVMGSAECVAVVPSMLKAGFVFGAQYGRGVASCRTVKGWSDPAFFTVQGGSFGLQIGGQAVDLVMLIMNQKGMENLLSSKFKLGANATVAAGPVGRWQADGRATVPPSGTRVDGQAEILCTRDRHLHSPTVRTYCSNHGIQVLTDIEVLQILRAATNPPTTP